MEVMDTEGRTFLGAKHPLRVARVSPERLRSYLGKSDATIAPGGLRGADNTVEHRASNLQRPGVEVYVTPLQPENLPAAHPGGHGQHVQRVETRLRVPRRVEQLLRLPRIQWLDLALGHSWRDDCIAHIAGDE